MAKAVVYRNVDGMVINTIVVDPDNIVDLGSTDVTIEVLPDQVVWDESTRPVPPENATQADFETYATEMQAWIEAQPTPLVLPSIGWFKTEDGWVPPEPTPEPEPPVDPEVFPDPPEAN